MTTPTTEEKEQVIKEILERVLRIDVHPFHRRGNEVLREMLLHGKGVKETSKILNLPLMRVKQLFPQATRTLCSKLDGVNEQLGNISELEREITKLKNKIASYEEKERQLKEKESKLSALPEEIQNILFKKMYEFDISIRALNVCKHNDIETLTDLVKLHRNQFLKLRNAGTKTVNELEQFIVSKGLHWNMDL